MEVFTLNISSKSQTPIPTHPNLFQPIKHTINDDEDQSRMHVRWMTYNRKRHIRKIYIKARMLLSPDIKGRIAIGKT